MSKVARSIHEITPTTTELCNKSMLPPILWFNIFEFIFTHYITFTDNVISADEAREISEALKTNCSITNITLHGMHATYILLNSLSLTLNCVFHTTENKLDAEGARIISEAFIVNQSIVYVSLHRMMNSNHIFIEFIITHFKLHLIFHS